MNDSDSDFLQDTDFDLPEHCFPEQCYCLRCGAKLYQTPVSECQKCRFQFNPADPQTYAAEPLKVSGLKRWLPGFCLSVTVGVISYAMLASIGEMGLALFFAVPFAVGALLGFTVRMGDALLGRVAIGVMAIVAIVCVVCMLSLSNFVGMFCGLYLSAIFLTPVVFGVVIGVLIRACLQATRFAHCYYLPILLIIAFPFGVQAVEYLFPHPIDIATVHTELILPASAADSWNSLMFYEDVDHEPPWLLKLALPRPVRGEGVMGQVGDTRRCIYENGYLTKQITERVEQRRLAFTVVEQHLHFERDVRLLSGSFELDPINSRQTRMTLTTKYERLLRPAWLWKPAEIKIVRTLHTHVLEGVRLKSQQLEKTPQRPHDYERPLESNRKALLQTTVTTLDD